MNKLILSITVLIISSSCASFNTVLSSYHYISTVDYSQFTKDGFFLTESNSVGFDYESLGSVNSYLMSGGKSAGYTPFTQQDLDRKQVSYSPEDAVRAIVEEAKKIGGNGIINLKLTSIRTKELPYNDQFTASGMVIKK